MGDANPVPVHWNVRTNGCSSFNFGLLWPNAATVMRQRTTASMRVFIPISSLFDEVTAFTTVWIDGDQESIPFDRKLIDGDQMVLTAWRSFTAAAPRCRPL